MKNKNIQCVSFPRSGIRLLGKQCLRRYFGKQQFLWCEFYTHCSTTPCPDPRTNFQKNHDLDLKLVNNPKFDYIILYRHPLEAITSLYEAELGWSIRYKGFQKPDNRGIWIKFLKEKIIYWKTFVKKWVIYNNNPNTYYLSYNEFMMHPVEKLTQVIEFINPKRPINPALIKNIVNNQDIGSKRDIRQFKYFDEDIFKKTESETIEEIKILKLNRYLI